MAYLGSKPQSGFISNAKERYTGITTAYVDLNHSIASLADVIVWVNYVKQDATNLTLTSSTRITLGATLVASDIVEIAYLGKAVATQAPATGTVTNDMLSGSIANAKLANDGITIGSDDTSLGGTITDLNGLTSVDVDNITLDANTISTTNSNGNLVLSPNGTGAVNVPSGYEARAGFGDDSLVNKSYVDSVANGLDVKASVRVATTANLAATYNNGNGTFTYTPPTASALVSSIADIKFGIFK